MRRLILPILLIAMLAACDGNPPSVIPFEDLPETGDAVRGEQVFNEGSNVVAPCSGCHEPESTGSPTLEDYAEVAGSRVDGQDAREYTFYAIVEPGRHIVEGYGNAMPNTYDDELSAQDIADLIAYLLVE